MLIKSNCQSTDNSSHCCTDTHLDNMDFETIMKKKIGGKSCLPEGQQTEKDKVTSGWKAEEKGAERTSTGGREQNWRGQGG